MYTIKVLEDKQFNQLPFKHVKTALGCADKKTNTAYVRKTHWGGISKAVDLLTIQHELDELVAKTSPHEIDGIRYKKAKQAVSDFGAGYGASYPGGYAPAGYADPVGSRALSTGTPDFGGGAGASYPGGYAPSGYADPVGVLRTGPTSRTVQPSTSLLAAGTPSTPGSVGPGIDPATTVLSGAIKPSPVAEAPKGFLSSLLQGVGDVIKGLPEGTLQQLINPMTAMGLGTMGIAALPLGPKPPDIGPIASKWLTADTVTKAGEEAKKIADIEYGGEFQPSKEIQAFISVQEKDIRKAYGRRRKDMDKMGLAMSGQFMRSGERLEMHRRLQEEEQAEVDKMQAEWLINAKQEHATRQFEYVMEQLKVDEAVKRDLLYADITDVMWKYNMEREDIMNFRKIAADAGMYMLAKGLGLSDEDKEGV